MGLLVINTAGNGVVLSYGTKDNTQKEQARDVSSVETLTVALKNFLQSLPHPPQHAIAVCVGPGGYTALRVSLTLAKMLSLSYHIPLMGLSSSAIYASGVKPHKKSTIAVVLETNRKHFYVEWYASHTKNPIDVAKMMTAQEILAHTKESAIFTGSGMNRLQQMCLEFGQNHKICMLTPNDISKLQYKLARKMYTQQLWASNPDEVAPLYYGNPTP